MKKGCLLILFILILAPCSMAAKGHRIGVGLGTASGKHELSGQTTDLKGEILELPIYTYVADSGLMVGFRLMEFSVKGEISSATERTEIAFKQTLMAVALGFEFAFTDHIIIAPQIVKSYFGNSRFNYNTYQYYSISDTSVEYVTDTDAIDGTADVSGWEIPLYYVGEFFYFGLKLSAYNNKSEIDWPAGSVSDVTITGATSIVLEARF